MNTPPAGSMKLVYVESEDKSGNQMLTDAQFDTLEVQGLIIRMASGRQIHGEGAYGHQRPGDYNDHSFNKHIQVAYDRGWLALVQFDLYLGWEFQMAGVDFEEADMQFVPFAYQLKNKTFGTSYHGIVLNIHDEGETGSNVAAKLTRFLEMIDTWILKYFPDKVGKIPIYLRLTRELWERDGGHVMNVMYGRDLIPYVLDGVTTQLSSSTVVALPDPYDADVWEPGNHPNYKYERACFWHYTDILITSVGKNLQAIIAWGTPDRIFSVLGTIPVKYDDGSGNDPGDPEDPPLPSIQAQLDDVLLRLEALKTSTEYAAQMSNNVFVLVDKIWNRVRKSIFKLIKGE